MDAAGFERAALVGVSEGGPASIVFSAAHPDRVRALVLMGSTAVAPVPFERPWEDTVDLDPSEIRRHIEDKLGAPVPDPTRHKSLASRASAGRSATRGGTGDAMKFFTPSIKSRQQLGMIERVSASPGMAARHRGRAGRPGRPVDSSSPERAHLVVHATDDIVPVQLGRHLADHIPGARLLEVAGHDHAPWLTATRGHHRVVEEFLTGAHVHQPSRRALRTLLFTDIVGSTDRAATVGDERWHVLLQRLRRDRPRDGRTIRRPGDQEHRRRPPRDAGRTGPGDPLRRGAAVPPSTPSTSTCDAASTPVSANSWETTSAASESTSRPGSWPWPPGRDHRLQHRAGPRGRQRAGLRRPRGFTALKGVPGEWRLLAVQSGGASATSREGMLAAHPTPAMSTGMRRSDRAMSVVARRAPGLMRGHGQVGRA